MPTRIQPFVAQASIPFQGVKEVITTLAPWGCAATGFKQSVGPLARQGVQPIALSMVTLRPGQVVPWEVAEPSMAECLRELSTTKPQSIDSRRIAGMSEFATEVSEAEPRGRVHQVASKSAGSRSRTSLRRWKRVADSELIKVCRYSAVSDALGMVARAAHLAMTARDGRCGRPRPPARTGSLATASWSALVEGIPMSCLTASWSPSCKISVSSAVSETG